MFSWFGLRRSTRLGAQASVLLEIEHSLSRVCEASRQDEDLALLANRIVRKRLDKHAINYADYRRWRHRNPLIFTAIVTDDGELIGFFDIFSLTLEAGDGIIAGNITEHSLRAEHLVPVDEIASSVHLHLATILINPRQKAFPKIVASEILLLKMQEFLTRCYSPAGIRSITAYGQTRAGIGLLKRCGFVQVALPSENEQGLPLFLLRGSETEKALSRFERAAAYFQRNDLQSLDRRVEECELRLRQMIVASVAASDIPSHVKQRAKERIARESSKNAAFDSRRYADLAAMLEFCDLREIQDIIVGKATWVTFEPRFGNKETLISKFDRLADLRNRIRHSRHIDRITRMEGEAAILWFEIVCR